VRPNVHRSTRVILGDDGSEAVVWLNPRPGSRMRPSGVLAGGTGQTNFICRRDSQKVILSRGGDEGVQAESGRAPGEGKAFLSRVNRETSNCRVAADAEAGETRELFNASAPVDSGAPGKPSVEGESPSSDELRLPIG